MMQISPARQVAFRALEAVENGAYASDILRGFSRPLTTRDAGLASQIVFGCLRFQKQLDFLLEIYSGRRTAKLDRPVLIALRSGIFQLRYLERIPPHAAVHDAVEWVKKSTRSAAGLVNAVLRKVNRDPVAWPDEGTALSIPDWMLARWTEHFGAGRARGIAEAALKEPVPYVRIARGDQSGDLPVEPTEIPGAYKVLGPIPPDMRLHDISSQAIVPLLNLQPSNSYLDLCAAPGNKTLQALENPLRVAVACDVSPIRIREIPPVCPRVVLDATQPLPFNRQFDRIFIDAPCSGTGTLARNPEIKWRVQDHDFGRFGGKQLQIAEQAVRLLAPGGLLVYATCSLEWEENEGVVSRLLNRHGELRVERELWRLPGRDEGDGFYAAALSRL
jgi:16S rRNA (cytosine967-C5)-methyltransferase